MSRNLAQEIFEMAKNTPSEDFGTTCPGCFFLVFIPGQKGNADALQFNTGIQEKVSSHYPPDELAPQTELDGDAIEPKPGIYLYEVKKTANNGWLDWIAIGRAKNNDVILRHQTVSKLHARIHKENADLNTDPCQGMWITDLNSTVGTWLNRDLLQPAEPQPLSIGDEIRFGKVECRFLAGKALHEAIHNIFGAELS